MEIGWLTDNWSLICLLLMVADKYVTKSKWPYDDLIFTIVKQGLSVVAGRKILGVLLGVGLVSQMVLYSGCAVKVISDLPPRSQAMATVDLMIDEYNDLYSAYTTALPMLSEEHSSFCKTDVAPAMNIAKRAIKLASDAAIMWSILDTSANATSQSAAYEAAMAEARDALDDALNLYQKIKGGE